MINTRVVLDSLHEDIYSHIIHTSYSLAMDTNQNCIFVEFEVSPLLLFGSTVKPGFLVVDAGEPEKGTKFAVFSDGGFPKFGLSHVYLLSY